MLNIDFDQNQIKLDLFLSSLFSFRWLEWVMLGAAGLNRFILLFVDVMCFVGHLWLQALIIIDHNTLNVEVTIPSFDKEDITNYSDNYNKTVWYLLKYHSPLISI